MEKKCKPHKAVEAILYNSPWAITPDGFTLMMQVVERENDLQAVLAKEAVPLENTERVTIRDNVGIVPVTGPIFRYSNLFTRLCGATSVAVLAKDFQTALDAPEVDAVILTFDSPGGMVAGINEVSDLIYAAREQKEIVAYVGEQAASAAYWMASATGRIVVDETAELGSIGVVAGYRKNDDESVVEIVSTASPKKRLKPDTDEGRAELLQRADDLAEVFITRVARNRGVSKEKVLSDFGQGGTLTGEKAVKAGLADETGSLEGLIRKLQTKRKEKFMNLKTFKAEHPDLYDQVKAEGAAEAEGKIESAVSAEKDRILGLAQSVFGEEAAQTFKKVVSSGVSVEQMAALSGVFKSQADDTDTADKASRKKILEGLQQAHSQGVKAEKEREKAEGKDDLETQAKNLAALANQ